MTAILALAVVALTVALVRCRRRSRIAKGHMVDALEHIAEAEVAVSELVAGSGAAGVAE